MKTPYKNLKVLDLSQVIAGPFCTRLLSDLGADVIRIEPRGGDILRTMPIEYQEGQSSAFAQYNSGKRSLGIDMKHPEGKQLVLRLIDWADVCVQNLRPGALERLGLGWDVLHSRNPELILCSISLFGLTGPYSEIGGHGMVAEAYSGLMSLTGEEGGPPSHFGTPLADMNAAVHALAAIGAALHSRTASGEGSHVDISSFDSLFAMIDQAVSQAVLTNGRREFGRYGTKHPQTVPSGVVQVANGEAVTFSAVGDQAWARLATVMEQPELKEDECFRTIENRIINRRTLYGYIDKWAAAFPDARTLVEALEEVNLPAARIRSVVENIEDPHLLERGTLQPVPLGKFGEVMMQSAPYRISGHEIGPQGRPPLLGEHNEEVLTNIAGLTDREVKEMYQRNVIYRETDNSND